MKQLHPDVLSSLPADVAVPAYDRGKVGVGIVHLGIGAFHRAHQLEYTDDVLASGDTEWGVCGVDLLGPDVRNKLMPQELLYSLSQMSGDSKKHRIIGALRELMVGPEDPAALVERMCDPAIRIVSITVTEKGYCHDPASGDLNFEHPMIKADLANPDRPSSIVGYITAALGRRRDAGTPPFTVLSCDNLFQNGKIIRRVVLAFAKAVNPDLAAWIEENVAFPCTMVDRITPATTPTDIAEVQAGLGVADGWPIVCEPFKQWVIEDHFPLGRPAWETAGAEIVEEVDPYEYMKLRLLNGSHSALAYLGSLAGYETISRCMEDPAYVTFMRKLMDEDVTPTLQMPEGVDVGAYKDSLVERFVNPAIKHLTRQIAMDGSQKLPNRTLGPVRERLAAGAPVDHLALVVAAWMRYATGVDEQGIQFEVNDPLAAALRKVGDAAGNDAEKVARGYLAMPEIFGDDLAGAEPFTEKVIHWLKSLYAKGAAATVKEAYGA